jgi:hypothetical protein
VEIAEMTAPSIIPIIGTIKDERSLTLLKNKKKTIVPIKEKMIAAVILWTKVGAGNNK